MKTYTRIYKRILATLLLLGGIAGASHAQKIIDKLHFTVDWQVNAPVNTDFADRISGWGAGFEANYDITNRWAVGGFINYHTNHRYICRQTLHLSPTESLTTDQQRSAFQLPFGLSAAFKLFDDPHWKPYIGLKTGAMYAKNTTYYNNIGWYDNPWGYYISPEIGIRIHPMPNGRFAVHVAGYYSYATNKSQVLTGSIDGQNNLGFRVGVSF